MLHRKPGGVTIPGEAGYEALTCALRKNGAQTSSVTATVRRYRSVCWIPIIKFTRRSV